MVRKLTPSTVIPEELYVRRAADRQLRQIIDQMGRPGYVLVSRQMGKTNLLLNMKRERERTNEIVAYFDLSRRFDSLRFFFRYIIDGFVEAAGEKLSPEIAAKLIDLRKRPLGEAASEYEQHLRLLLRETHTPRVIFILDEVDSLVNVTYSDKVFSQIRAMYFSRPSHREYERLTYVLSGVAEPSALIKDKDISPFNIGEKIYLDDFTPHEFRELIKKANLSWPEDIIQETYAWTSGNPRMSWDLCSELELTELSGTRLTRHSVDAAVRKLYLDRFDRPPVDHIRYRVENDPELLHVIMNRRALNTKKLSESVKSKLYLAGITAGNLGSGQIEIKNKILREALSDSWLLQVASRRKALLEIATDHFVAGRYREAIAAIEHFTRNEPGQALPLRSRFQLGMAKLRIGDHTGAANELRKILCSDGGGELVAQASHYLGLALLRGGRPEESVSYFRKAAEVPGPFQFESKVSVGSALLASATSPGVLTEVIQTAEDVIDELGQLGGALDDDRRYAVTAAHINLAEALRLQGYAKQAISHLDIALETATRSEAPKILLLKINLMPREQAGELAEEASTIVVDHQLTPQPPVLALTLALLLREQRHDAFERTLQYVQEQVYPQRSRSNILLGLFHAVKPQDELPLAARLVWRAIDEHIDSDIDVDDALRVLLRDAPKDLRQRVYKKFLSRITERLEQHDTFVEEEVFSIVNLTMERIHASDLREALRLVEVAKRMVQRAPIAPVTLCLVLQNELEVRHAMRDQAGARNAATSLLRFAQEQGERTGDVTIENFRRRAANFLGSHRERISRNAIVVVRDIATGVEYEKKYKHVEAEVRSGRLMLVKISNEPKRLSGRDVNSK